MGALSFSPCSRPSSCQVWQPPVPQTCGFLRDRLEHDGDDDGLDHGTRGGCTRSTCGKNHQPAKRVREGVEKATGHRTWDEGKDGRGKKRRETMAMADGSPAKADAEKKHLRQEVSRGTKGQAKGNSLLGPPVLPGACARQDGELVGKRGRRTAQLGRKMHE
eukprot:scaffold544_cov320-Pavlova_lutheri.AAC.27